MSYSGTVSETELQCPQCPGYTPTFFPRWNQNPTRYMGGWHQVVKQQAKGLRPSLVQEERPERERENGLSQLETESWRMDGRLWNVGFPRVHTELGMGSPVYCDNMAVILRA